MGDILKDIESQGLSKKEVQFLIDMLDDVNDEFNETQEEFDKWKEKYIYLTETEEGKLHKEECEDCAAFCVRFRKADKVFTDSNKEHEFALKIKDKLNILKRNR